MSTPSMSIRKSTVSPYPSFRNLNDEATTIVVVGIVVQITSQAESMALCQRQAQSQALGEVVNLHEWLEYQCLRVLMNTRTYIFHCKMNSRRCLCNAQIDVLSVRVFSSIEK